MKYLIIFDMGSAFQYLSYILNKKVSLRVEKVGLLFHYLLHVHVFTENGKWKGLFKPA